MTTTDIPTWTYILDALGIFGVVVGGYVASKSVYSKENTKDAAILIDTQRKRIDILVDTVTQLETARKNDRTAMDKLSGELKAYKNLALVSPDIISKLTTTLDAILTTLTKDGIHIDTQKVDTQIIGAKK